MSDHIKTKDRNGADINIAAEDRGGVLHPLNHIMDAAGAKINPATEATMAALNVIAAAVQSAVDAINGKTTAVNTDAISGTVALDAPTLAALESIQATTGGLTDAQLRAEALAVTLSSDDVGVLGDILQALGPLMSARGTDGSLRIQSQSGTLTSITTVGTVTTVTTVATVTTVGTVSNVANQTAIGGLQAANQIPSLMNLAAASNLDRMVG
jgi:hypothetical protein